MTEKTARNADTNPAIEPLRITLDSEQRTRIECTLHGGAADQIRWLSNTKSFVEPALGSVLDEALDGVENGWERLIRALAYPGLDGRDLAARELLRDLWRVDGGLGPYPGLDTLAIFQQGGRYYRLYRDHLAHQLRVWVLGLYLLGKVPRLREAQRTGLQREDAERWGKAGDTALDAEILRRWKIASLWHDIGYVFEVQSGAEPLADIDRAFADIDRDLRAPLTALLGTKDAGIPGGAEDGWYDDSQYDDLGPLPRWRRLHRFDELTRGRNRRLWQELAPAGHAVGLAPTNTTDGGLFSYFELCRRGEMLAGGKRPAFIDHGIAGALLLLRIHHHMERYGKRLSAFLVDSEESVQPELLERVRSIDETTRGALPAVLAAARAVALHNVHPWLPETGSAHDKGLTPERYRLCADVLPLAHLLTLADGLQEWDRPRYAPPMTPKELSTLDQECLVLADERGVFLDYPGDRADAGTKFAVVRNELGSYIDGVDDADGLLRWDPDDIPEPAQRLEREDANRSEVLAPTTPEDWDLVPYLHGVLRTCGTLEMRGIMAPGADGEVNNVPIEELYAPLRVEGGADDEALWRTLAGEGSACGVPDERATLRMHGRRQRRVRADGESDHFDAERGLLLVGKPGSGKSTFLRFTAAVLAHARLGEQDEGWRGTAPPDQHPAVINLGEDPDNIPLPVFIRLSEFADFLVRHRGEEPLRDAHGWLRRYLEHHTGALGAGIPGNVLESWLREGHVVVMLDGLDEIPSRELREQIGGIVGQCLSAQTYGACRFCVTSRPLHQEAIPLPMTPRTLAGLAETAIERFLLRWAELVGRSSQRTEEDNEAYVSDLLGQARNAPPEIRRMLRNPLMLTCLAVIHWNHQRLPEQRAELFEAILRWLIRARRARDDAPIALTEVQARRVYQSLALKMHTAEDGREKDLALVDAAGAVARFMPGETDADREHAARDFFEGEVVNSGIVVLRRPDQLAFWHLTFQEFLVADYLKDSTEREWNEELTTKRLFLPAWHEVVLLLAGLLRGGNRVDDLLRRISILTGTGQLAEKARMFGLVSGVLRDLSPTGYKPPADLDLDTLESQVMAIFTVEGSAQVPLEDRLEAAEALGRTGDPRMNEDPWVQVPAGEFIMGGDKGALLASGAKRRWSDRFYIAWRPVVVADFRRFVEEDGYRDNRWWNAGRYRKMDIDRPGDWDEQLEHPTRPVVNVCWFEASAFAAWATARWEPPEGGVIRLPTEMQWERAARGTRGDLFPWGDRVPATGESIRANFREIGEEVQHPTPVGVFPGNNRGRLTDLSGNVWEWCMDTWRSPRDESWHRDSVECHASGKDTSRVIRGGAWAYNPRFLRCASRHRFYPAIRYVGLGFRLVTVVPREQVARSQSP